MAKFAIPAGTTSVTINVFILDSSSTTGQGLAGLLYNTSSLTAYYCLPRASAAAITLATQTVTGAWATGGFVEIDATHMKGWYRLDLPNAVIASGNKFVSVHLYGATNMAPLTLEIDLNLVNYVWDELNTGTTNNVTNSTGKQLRSVAPNTSGIYTSTLPSQSGVTSVQVKLDSGASSVDNAYQFDVFSVTSGTGQGSAICTSYTGSTRLATVDTAWAVQPVATDVVEVTASAKSRVISYATGQDPFTMVMIGDMSTITGEAARSPLNALRFLRNKWSITAGTLTVTKEDDTTSAWTSALTVTAGADPITGFDPA